MDVDYLSSSSEAQMDMMTMMMEMEMEKLSELSKAPLQLSGGYSGGPSPALCNATAAATTSHAPSSLSVTAPGPQYLLTPMFLSSQTGAELWLGGPAGGCGGPSVTAMREMIFRIAAMQPIHIDQELAKPPKRRNVKISKDPQSVAARHRRGRISERIRILQQLVPGGTKMDTASMLDEAIHYMKFLKSQVQTLERAAAASRSAGAVAAAGFTTVGAEFLDGNYSCSDRGYEASDRWFVMNTSSDAELK